MWAQCIVSVSIWEVFFVSARTNKRQHHSGGGLQPGAALVVVCLAVVTLPPRSTAPTVAGCCLVGCSVISGPPLRSRAVAGVSQHVCVCLGPVLASHAPSPPATAAAAWRERGRVPIAGWSYGGVGQERGLLGGGRRGWCEEWACLSSAKLRSTDSVNALPPIVQDRL
jgi:hypothetical protein